MKKESFLMARSHVMSAKCNECWNYDNYLGLNTILHENKSIPVCTLSWMITRSKTESAPGDDDPDPDAESMY